MKSLLFAALLAAASLAPALAHDESPATPAERPELAIGRSAAFNYDPPEPGSYRLPAIAPAADGTVLDERGEALSLGELFRGRISVLAFVYTRCADICPEAMLLLHDLHGLSALDPAIAANVQLLTLSFDPEHDTPEVMAMTAEAWRQLRPEAAPWRFLTTAGEEALKPLLDAYDQPVARKDDPLDPLGPLAHQLRIFLVDRAGTIRNIYSLGFLDPRLVMTDLRTLLLETERKAAQPVAKATRRIEPQPAAPRR